MKTIFIRTKDDIYEVSEKDRLCIIETLDMPKETGYVVNQKFINDNDIVSKSEDILELCDGFYIEDGSNQFKKDHIFETVLEFENAYRKARVSDTYAKGYGFILNYTGLVFIDISDYLRSIK